MKILIWNIEKFSRKNLNRGLGSGTIATQIANTAGDFIAKAIGFSDAFQLLPFFTPATGAIDVFVILEVQDVWHGPGNPVATDYPLLLSALVTAINTEAQQSFLASPPVYDYVRPSLVKDDPPTPPSHEGGPVVSTGDETIAFIYNTTTVTPNDGWLLYPPSSPPPPAVPQLGGAFINRLPFLMDFTDNATGNTFAIVANHAPPTKSGPNGKYENPVCYSNELAGCYNPNFTSGAPLAAQPGAGATVLIGGDFNCSIISTYGNPPVRSFENLFPAPAAFETINSLNTNGGTLNLDLMRSSKRDALKGPQVNGSYPPDTYLNEAYDDILYPSSLTGVSGGVLDVIGEVAVGGAKVNANTNFRGWVTAFGKISDHLPVGISF